MSNIVHIALVIRTPTFQDTSLFQRKFPLYVGQIVFGLEQRAALQYGRCHHGVAMGWLDLHTSTEFSSWQTSIRMFLYEQVNTVQPLYSNRPWGQALWRLASLWRSKCISTIAKGPFGASNSVLCREVFVLWPLFGGSLFGGSTVEQLSNFESSHALTSQVVILNCTE